MKLIALKSFRNVASLRLREEDGASKVDGSIHSDHVHKGAVFDVGAAKDLDGLRKADRPSAEIVAQLFIAGCIGDATDAKTVQAVKDELAAEARKEETAKKADAQSSAAQLGEQVVANLKRQAQSR